MVFPVVQQLLTLLVYTRLPAVTVVSSSAAATGGPPGRLTGWSPRECEGSAPGIPRAPNHQANVTNGASVMYVTDVRLPGLPLGGILSGGLQLEPHQAADAQRAISKVCQVRGGRGCGGQGDSFRVSHCHRGARYSATATSGNSARCRATVTPGRHSCDSHGDT